jgi:serine/threonine-protein kinase HipA
VSRGDSLSIWLHGRRIAAVESERRRLRLRYTRAALESFPAGTPLLSLRLPLSEQPFPNGAVRTFLDGLLPEGDARRAIAEDLRLRADDTFGLARALGRDCAGALVIQPEQDPAPAQPTTLTAEPLGEERLGRLLDNLRIAPLGVDGRVRISLAGVQEKLLLTRLPDGRWGRPVDGTPSTHILKPEIHGYPRTVQNEAFCMRLAKHLGLSVADVEVQTIAGRKLLVVARYDRLVDAETGAVERIHQEDMCQATATPPLNKYEEDGGPSLLAVARVLREVDPDSLEELLRATTLNVAIGNGDAHAKNLSLLHGAGGRLRLAPLYDLMSTLVYGRRRLAMYVDRVQRTDRVSAERLIEEAGAWGLARPRAQAIVEEMLARLPAGIERAAEEIEDSPRDVRLTIARQARMLSPDTPASRGCGSGA